MSVRSLTLTVGGVLLVALAGCTSASSSTVTVSGTLAWNGGVATSSSPPYHVMPGVVVLTGGGQTRTVTADAQGHFSARVPRGTYVVTGTSSHFNVNGIEGTCRAAGTVDASRDRSGVLVLCAGV